MDREDMPFIVVTPVPTFIAEVTVINRSELSPDAIIVNATFAPNIENDLQLRLLGINTDLD